jgi:hypothetical protein
MTQSSGSANQGEGQIYGNVVGDTAMHGSTASIHQPRLDQIVQAIERNNSMNTVQQLQRPDTRLLEMGRPQLQRPTDNMSTQRVSKLLPTKNIAPHSSPLLPARSWS